MPSTDRTLAYLLSIVLICTFAAGCTGGGDTTAVPETTTPVHPGVGISDITPAETTVLIPLADARSELAVYWVEDLGNNGTPPTYQVNGVNVNADGMAAVWIFGVQRDDGYELLSFDGQRWSPMKWPEALSGEVIDWEAVLSPEDLYSMNLTEIREHMNNQATDVSGLWLKDGRYTVMIGAGHNLSSLAFNATTGEMIPFV